MWNMRRCETTIQMIKLINVKSNIWVECEERSEVFIEIYLTHLLSSPLNSLIYLCLHFKIATFWSFQLINFVTHNIHPQHQYPQVKKKQRGFVDYQNIVMSKFPYSFLHKIFTKSLKFSFIFSSSSCFSRFSQLPKWMINCMKYFVKIQIFIVWSGWNLGRDPLSSKKD
jgi:hypothetical protein